MPLQSNDVKIFKSDKMNDEAAGGGSTTHVAIVGGESNNIFDDVSQLDRVTGRLSMRKVFPSVFIQSLDKYYGSHTILSKIPKDDMVNVALFTTGDHHDRRDTAAKALASYLGKGANYGGTLLNQASLGVSTFQMYQGVDVPVPDVGDVLLLEQGSDQQYIRITDVQSADQTFTVGTDTFVRKIVEIVFSTTLDYTFIGLPISKDDNLEPATVVYKTVVQDSARFYGARPLSDAVVTGATSVKADTLFMQLIPSSLIETSIADVGSNGDRATTVTTAETGQATFTTSSTMNNGYVLNIGSVFAPGSLTIETTSGNITDADGNLYHSGIVIGSANYSQKTVTFSSNSPTFYGSKTVKFSPGTQIAIGENSAFSEVTVANRGLVYNKTLATQIGRGSLIVSYQVLGEWYELRDNGAGGISGSDPSIGSGNVNYDTNTVSVTLGELPDVGSSLIYSWGSTVLLHRPYNYPTASDPLAASIDPVTHGFAVCVDLGDIPLGIDFSTASLSWGSRTATTNADGTLVGDASGRIVSIGTNYYLKMVPNALPAQGDVLTLTHNDLGRDVSVDDYSAGAAADGSITYTLPQAPQAGSVAITFKCNLDDKLTELSKSMIPGQVIIVRQVVDDGNGNLLDLETEETIGTINYATGVVSANPKIAFYKDFEAVQNGLDIEIKDKVYNDIVPSGNILTYYNPSAAASNALTQTHTINDLRLLLGGDTYSGGEVLSNSVRFKQGSTVYYDQDGSVYKDPSNPTLVGTIALSSAHITINTWQSGVSNGDVTVENLVARKAPIIPGAGGVVESLTGVSRMVFKIDAVPVKSESLNITVPYVMPNGFTSKLVSSNSYLYGFSDGQQITTNTYDYIEGSMLLVADANGDITSSNTGAGTAVATGTLDHETGVVKLEFTDSSGTAPQLIDPSKLTYTCVAKESIPIDEAILGIDPVRLPENGRVPAYRKGDVVVIHDFGGQVLSTASNGDVVNIGDTLLASCSVTDSAGADVADAKYTLDLSAGTLTWVDVSGVSLPVTLSYTIEDMSMVTDVQIDGTVSLALPIKHDYVVGTAMVSNALIHGDLFASVSEPFDQNTWSGVWSNELIGNATLGELNVSGFPVVVDNASCIEERWLLEFVSATSVNVIGEQSGQVLTSHSIGTDCAPINPLTGFPYFTIPAAAFGGGWSSGNVVRFNTSAAGAPVWVVRGVNQGTATDTSSDALGFCLNFRGSRNTVV